MIIALDTATPVCRLWLVDDAVKTEHTWDAGRGLADGIFKFIRESMKDRGYEWADISGIVAFRGPGSFTGLRIGLTVLNTIADDRKLPIVGEVGDQWLSVGLERLKGGDSDGLVMPLYGGEPNITKPRK